MLFDEVGFDPGFELAAGLLIDERRANLPFDLAEWADAWDFVLFELDDMKAVAGANNRRNLAGLQRFHTGEDLVHDVAWLEPSELAAVGFRVVVRKRAREIVEVSALGRAGTNHIGFLLR